jgi:energy-coupling factor transporter transmembrane protein EcfT
MSFIPAEFELWGMIDRSWKARGGKNGIKKIKTLSFVFMSISFYKADKKAKAISARI